ncbi:C1D-domain-containing protein [Myriangium duriaei CBS 260.36]|uniref:Exosome complex protein n=1 Tax=Myriangium duriaei CBS 260.36 TaxID=1168546 RepID=A0A9P4MDT8_9PEZI|nr:C1D-domain-containing protein [Myriangium duriaei CBS 260.36]
MAAETDSTAIEALLRTLSKNVDGVEAALHPITTKTLSATSGKLPLLDQAKLYVHTAYAIESLIFSYLRLSGVDAKSHPIFSELSRVRAYFQKIKSTESTGPSSKLDKGAANRFIKHALSGNDEYDRKREEAQKSQESGAKRKFDELAERYGKQSRFEGASKRMKDGEADSETIVTAKATQSRHGDHTTGSGRSGASSAAEEDASSTLRRKPSKGKKYKHTTDAGEPRSSRHRQKHSHPPKDAHQAFQSLLSRSAKPKADGGDGKEKPK